MLEAMLIDLAAGEGADLLVSAGGNIVTKCKDAHHWKKVFVDTGKFFIEHERYAEQILLLKDMRIGKDYDKYHLRGIFTFQGFIETRLFL